MSLVLEAENDLSSFCFNSFSSVFRFLTSYKESNSGDFPLSLRDWRGVFIGWGMISLD